MRRILYYGSTAALLCFYAASFWQFTQKHQENAPAALLPVDLRKVEPIGVNENRCWSLASDSSELALSGWSAPEPAGRWSEQKQTSIQLKLTQNELPRHLVIEGIFFVHEKVPDQKVEVLINGNKAALWHAKFNNWVSNSWRAPLPSQAKNGMLDFTFLISAPTSPRSLGMGDDGRTLGLFIKRLCLANVPLDNAFYKADS